MGASEDAPNTTGAVPQGVDSNFTRAGIISKLTVYYQAVAANHHASKQPCGLHVVLKT